MSAEFDMRAWERVLDAIRDQGRDDGANAAEWWAQEAIGGRAATGDTERTARRTIAGMDDCDPEICDGLPHADLSGEMADGITARTLYEGHRTDELPEWFYDLPEWCAGEIANHYEEKYNEAAESGVTEACRAVL